MAQVETPSKLVKRIHWTVLRPLARALGGNERSLVFGPGALLDELREYRPGDDVRNIDWNVLARTQQPYVRMSPQERALDVWMLADVSQSFSFGTAQLLKRDLAIEFALAVSSLLTQHGNRVGGILFAQDVLKFVRPANGAGQIAKLLDAMQEAGSTARTPHAGTTDLATALNRAFALIPKKALLFVLTDFITPSRWQPALRKLSEKHEVIAVQIYDPRERELPDTGVMQFEDPETGKQLRVDTRDARLRERYKQAAAKQALEIRDAIRASGAAHLPLSTADDMVKEMVRFVRLRKQRMHGR